MQVMANPLPPTGAGVDPGWYRGYIFKVNSLSASLISASGCSASVSTTTTTSASAYQSSFSQSVGISASYGSSSMSADFDYQTQNSGTDSSKAFSFVSGTIAQVAVGQLKTLNTLGMELDPSFLHLATQLRDSTGTTRDSLLRSMYLGYGT